ncbi:uncharacterized protein [Parasteatoda tepidariorum]|uniref:uncharacterized protein n=1 Tax=Parasteatoda tepidariorum TaxID=114398 RepID=UPI0039BD71B2
MDLPEDEITKCEKEHCHPACFEETFEVARQITEKYSETGCGYASGPTQNIHVAIYLNGMETVTYSYSPKFEVIETFSYIGGYVGIWLGISLIAVFDFLETVVLILSYPFKNYMKARKRNGRTKRIKNLARDL